MQDILQILESILQVKSRNGGSELNRRILWPGLAKSRITVALRSARVLWANTPRRRRSALYHDILAQTGPIPDSIDEGTVSALLHRQHLP